MAGLRTAAQRQMKLLSVALSVYKRELSDILIVHVGRDARGTPRSPYVSSHVPRDNVSRGFYRATRARVV